MVGAKSGRNLYYTSLKKREDPPPAVFSQFPGSFPANSLEIRTRKEDKMDKYLFSAEQLKQLIERSIDLFLKYQYGRGYEEPMAKAAAVMDVIGSLKTLGREMSEAD